jgi:hypothetical protein
MPPIPPGGWTRENLRTHWRERIVNSPSNAPLSHAELAEFLRARNTFWKWFWGIRSDGVVNEPPGPDTCFELRIKVLPSLAAVLVFFLAWLVFANFPSVLGIYPMMILPEDTLCILERPHIFPRRTYRCDSLIAATDLSLVSSLLVTGLLVIVFFRQGGMVTLTDNQRTKNFIHHEHKGDLGIALIFKLVMTSVLFFTMKYYIVDEKVFLSTFVVILLILPGLIPWVLFRLWHAIRAGFVIIFFYMTGRFPSSLEDLSP